MEGTYIPLAITHRDNFYEDSETGHDSPSGRNILSAIWSFAIDQGTNQCNTLIER